MAAKAVEVIRGVNRLAIRWEMEKDQWTVTKRIDPDQRSLAPASVSRRSPTGAIGNRLPNAAQARQAARELNCAADMAERMDVVFHDEGDFDLVVIDDPDPRAHPALIATRQGKIYISLPPQTQERKD